MMSYLPKFQKYCIILTVWGWDVEELTAIIHRDLLLLALGDSIMPLSNALEPL